MSDIEKIAEEIDRLTIDELIDSVKPDLPVAGGDYDTRSGWASRLSMDKKSQRFNALWDKLESAGALKICDGYVKGTGRLYRTKLFHCPVLAKKLA